MKRLKGSFSIEAALITPLLMFLFGIAMNAGLLLHEETKELCLQMEKQDKMEVIDTLYHMEALGEILGGIDEN